MKRTLTWETDPLFENAKMEITYSQQLDNCVVTICMSPGLCLPQAPAEILGLLGLDIGADYQP